MLFGRSPDFDWFYQRSRVDGLVCWRCLMDSAYRRKVRQRWTEQPLIMTATEVVAGVSSLLLQVLVVVGLISLC